MSDSYLLDAGWFFFAAWGVVVLFVSWAAFGRDLFPRRAYSDPAKKSPSSDPAQTSQSAAR